MCLHWYSKRKGVQPISGNLFRNWNVCCGFILMAFGILSKSASVTYIPKTNQYITKREIYNLWEIRNWIVKCDQIVTICCSHHVTCPLVLRSFLAAGCHILRINIPHWDSFLNWYRDWNGAYLVLKFHCYKLWHSDFSFKVRPNSTC